MSIFSKNKKSIWTHISEPTTEQLQEIIKTYDLHSIVEDDLLSWVIQDKVDSYDDHLFIVVHFPKYDSSQEKYYANPLFIIITKDAIVTISKHPIEKLRSLHESYENTNHTHKNDVMQSPYYLLYKIFDVMYDKVLLSLGKFAKDVQFLEQDLFNRQRLNSKILSHLIVKRRNIIFVNHMLAPQTDILVELHTAVMKVLKEDGDIYFEDLQYKFDKIMHTIQTVNENTRSLSTTYNALANIQTNSVISLLTIFTATIGILAVITGLYGMNVSLPGQESPYAFHVIMGCMGLFLMGGLIFAKRRDRR